MKIGIIGGSFDPIHYGHLIMAETLRQESDLEGILFVPTGVAPHKIYQTEASMRAKMVEMAINDNKYFHLCEIEVKKQKISYTYETLKELKELRLEDEFYFIIGLDNLYDISNWNNIRGLGQLTDFLLVNRLGYYDVDVEDIEAKISELKRDYDLNIDLIETPIIEISSSMIREKVKKGYSIEYLTAKEVVDYIEENGLYKRK